MTSAREGSNSPSPRSIKLLRGTVGSISIGQIVEKGFFIDSAKCLPIQLADLCALTLRKQMEVQRGLAAAKSIDHGAYRLIEPLIYRGDEAFTDVMVWLTSEEKKKRPGKQIQSRLTLAQLAAS